MSRKSRNQSELQLRRQAKKYLKACRENKKILSYFGLDCGEIITKDLIKNIEEESKC